MASVQRSQVLYEDPPIARFLFSDTRMAWVWLIVRVYLAYSWLSAGWGKLNSPAWTQTGEALKGYWAGVIATPAGGKPVITFDWYRDFLVMLLNGGHYVWFSKLVVAGELLVGAALLVGAFAGLAAFFGAFMNWNYLMAGTASTNPALLVLGIGLILAWKTAGYWGADRWLLPLLGTPWRPGVAFGGSAYEEPVDIESSRRKEEQQSA